MRIRIAAMMLAAAAMTLGASAAAQQPVPASESHLGFLDAHLRQSAGVAARARLSAVAGAVTAPL